MLCAVAGCNACCAGAKLEEVLKPLSLGEQRAALQYELSYGQLAEGADSGWPIMHSTLPGRAGEQLLGHGVSRSSLRELAAKGGKLQAGVYGPAEGWTLSDWSEGIPEQPVS